MLHEGVVGCFILSKNEKSACVSQNVQIHHITSYNPVSVHWQRQSCQELGLLFVGANGSTPGGADVPLKHPTKYKSIEGDGIHTEKSSFIV